MPSSIRKEFRPVFAELRERILGLGRKTRLAPGELSGDQHPVMTDRHFFLKLRDEHGPIFKIWQKGKITTCIIGPELGARFVKENRGKLRNGVRDLSYLFPLGFIRGMEGPDHTKYRRILGSAFRAVAISSHEKSIRDIMRSLLFEMSAKHESIDSMTLTLFAKKLATSVMLQLILGAEFETEAGKAMAVEADRYTPNGMNRHISKEEFCGFKALRKFTTEQAERYVEMEKTPASLIAHIAKSGDIDETIIGNLVQMVELGRFDMQSLIQWNMLEMAGQQGHQRKISAENNSQKCRVLAMSAAQETLRMHQSEYLARIATQSIEFDGYFIPKNSAIRICIWEGHRDGRKFAKPDTFDPMRFAANDFPRTAYAPLGLDHHKCLAAQWTYDISALLWEEVASTHHLGISNYGTPALAKFHYEPGSDCKITMSRKVG